MSNETTAPKKRGCLLYGCLTLIVLSLVGALLTYFAVRQVKQKLDALVAEYTDTAPMPLETVNISAEQLQALQQRVAAFREALQNQASAEELVLSADDINALIAHDPAYKEAKDKLFVLIEGDRVKGKVSIPLDNLGPFRLKGRYLNGIAALRVALENGQLDLGIDQIEVNGKSLPEPILAEFRKKNLAQDISRDPKAAENLQKFESIQVKDGKVILRSRAKP